MTEVSGNVSGAAVANGSGWRWRTRAAKEAARGGNFFKVEMPIYASWLNISQNKYIGESQEIRLQKIHIHILS